MTDAARADHVLRAGSTCWRTAHAGRFGVIVDAAQYFAAARAAMLEAEDTILLIGWDFDLRIELVPGEPTDGGPNALGPFLKHLVRRKPRLRILILKWDMAVLFTGNQLLPIFGLDLRSVERVRLRFDSKHPWTAAHHQKIVVIDDVLAFCGGIDMTVGRWDTCEHAPDDVRRNRPDGTPADPWHDATAVVDGEAAHALGDVARARWRNATGRRLPVPRGAKRPWPSDVVPQFRNVEVGIARTMPEFDGRPEIREIEQLYLAAIRTARRSIYIESQYFASVSICEALEDRLAEVDGPEIVVINPLSTKGWLEQETMGAARDLRLTAIARADRYGRFGIYHPVNAAGNPIYVHAKILMVDDHLIRVGSSNINNRSMGFDTECDLALEAHSQDERAAIAALRENLLAEHLDVNAGGGAIGIGGWRSRAASAGRRTLAATHPAARDDADGRGRGAHALGRSGASGGSGSQARTSGKAASSVRLPGGMACSRRGGRSGSALRAPEANDATGGQEPVVAVAQ